MKKRGVLFFTGIIMMLLKIPILQAQDTVRLSLYFDYAQPVLDSVAVASLDSLAVLVRNRSAEAIRITGNTDDRGSHGFNQRLSDARAQAVFDYLSAKGIGSVSLEILGQGKSLPAFPGKDDRSRAANRRVDLLMVLAAVEKPANLPPQAHNPCDSPMAADLAFSNGISIHLPEGAIQTIRTDSLYFTPALLTDAGKMAAGGITTLTPQNELLSLAGIFSINPKNSRERPDSVAFSGPVEVKVPARACACREQDVRLWQKVTDQEGHSRWISSAVDSVRLQRQSGSKYYLFPVRSREPLALGCTISSKRITLTLHNLDSVSLLLAYSRARVVTGARALVESSVEVRVPEGKEIPRIYATAWAEGEKYMIRGKRLDELRKNLFTGQYVMSRKDFRKVPGRSPRKVDQGEVIYGYAVEIR